MDARPPQTRPPNPRSSIRWCSVAIALVHWGLWTSRRVSRGQALPDATLDSLTCIGGSLACWWIYHGLSRQNNGMMLMLVGGGMAHSGQRPSALRLMAASTVIAIAAALFDRWYRRSKRRPTKAAKNRESGAKPVGGYGSGSRP